MKIGDLFIYKDPAYPQYKLNNYIGIITNKFVVYDKKLKQNMVLYFVRIKNNKLVLPKDLLTPIECDKYI
tara:strand:- start:2195 stop:2404 length:210 start_codon:yes stop_codon:yes gene_type:complete